MTPAGLNLRINSARLWDSLEQMARIGPGVAGGSNRQTLTDEDSQGRHLLRQWAEAAGMRMSVDRLGNMFFLRPGTDPAALPVAMGSHLDTQPTGLAVTHKFPAAALLYGLLRGDRRDVISPAR